MTTVRHCAAHGRGGATRSNVIITALAVAVAVWVALTAPQVSPVTPSPTTSAVSVPSPPAAKLPASPTLSAPATAAPVPADGERARGQR